jgi:hypothetical protein
VPWTACLERQTLTTTAIRSVPTNLPHARIFLDDLIEIESLLIDEFSRLPNAESISFEYAIDGNIAMTTHEELIEHGGYATEFSLSISNGSRRLSTGLLDIGGGINPRFNIPYQLKESEWAVYGKVEQIFEARKDRLKSFCQSVPSWVMFCFWAIIAVLGSAGSTLRGEPAFIARPLLMAYFAVGAVFFPFMSVLLLAYFRKNRIYFRRIRQDQKARTDLAPEKRPS